MNEQGISKEYIEKNRNIFYRATKKINQHLKEENLSLTFEGYTDTLSDYVMAYSADLEMLDKLARELNLWSNYMADLKGFIEFKMLKYENMYLYISGFIDKKFPNPELESKFKVAKDKFNDFKLYCKLLESQEKMFISAHKHCISQYSNSVEQLIYKNIN